MGRLSLAFRTFFQLLFGGALSDDVITSLGLHKEAPAPPPPPAPTVRTSDGALQILSILQRDARLIDFLMEDISGYSDDQVGAAVRSLHEQSRESLSRYVKLTPVIDGVEGSFAKPPAGTAESPGTVKFIGNVPAKGRPGGGLLRHKGWRAERVDLPAIASSQDSAVIAPAEIEIE